MGFIIVIYLISTSIFFVSGIDYGWKDRMQILGALQNCEYYPTSGTNYVDFFQLNELHDKGTEDHIHRFKFYHIGIQEDIKFKIYTSENRNILQYFEDNLPPSFNAGQEPPGYASGEESTEQPDVIMNRLRLDTNTDSSETDSGSSNSSDYSDASDISSAESDRSYDSNLDDFLNRTRRVSRGSYIEALQTDYAHDIFPNEVLVDIFKNGTMRVSLNDDILKEKRILNAYDLRFYSFAASQPYKIEKFYHNCDEENSDYKIVIPNNYVRLMNATHHPIRYTTYYPYTDQYVERTTSRRYYHSEVDMFFQPTSTAIPITTYYPESTPISSNDQNEHTSEYTSLESTYYPTETTTAVMSTRWPESESESSINDVLTRLILFLSLISLFARIAAGLYYLESRWAQNGTRPDLPTKQTSLV